MAEKEEDEGEDCCSGLLGALASAAAACAGMCWAPEDKHVGKYRYCFGIRRGSAVLNVPQPHPDKLCMRVWIFLRPPQQM